MTAIKTNKKPILKVFSELIARMNLSSKFGEQYGGDRKLYEALGYKTELVFSDYYAQYKRQDIAKAIIDRPVNAMWRGELSIIESDSKDKTAIEKAYDKLEKELKLKSRFMRADKLAGIGEYGILLLGLSDTNNKAQFAKPVTGTNNKLLYVKPFSQAGAEITTKVTDTKSERYGLPLYYTIKIDVDTEVKVHYSRVIHIIDDVLESETLGSPRLEVVYNRLQDLEKIVGGDAEMFWRGARPGYTGKVDADHEMTTTMSADLQNQIAEYENNLSRFLVNDGVDIKALTQAIADPANHVDIQLQMISAVTNIPKRILTGSERGELSSTQDKTEWNIFVQGRREEFAEPRIIRPFIDACMKYGVLPVIEEYSIEWNDLFALSDKEKMEIGKGRATALKDYSANGMAEATIPPEAFLRYFLGFTDEQIDMIEDIKSKIPDTEKPVTEEEVEIINEEEKE